MPSPRVGRNSIPGLTHSNNHPGSIKPEGMITKVIELDKVEDDGFKTLINDKENQVKILVNVAAGLS